MYVCMCILYCYTVHIMLIMLVLTSDTNIQTYMFIHIRGNVCMRCKVCMHA